MTSVPVLWNYAELSVEFCGHITCGPANNSSQTKKQMQNIIILIGSFVDNANLPHLPPPYKICQSANSCTALQCS